MELDVSDVWTVDGHASADVFQVDVAATALQVQRAFKIYRAHPPAGSQIQAHSAADVRQAHASALGSDLYRAIDLLDVEVAVAPVRFNRRSPGHSDLHVRRDPRQARGAILIGADDNGSRVSGQLQRRFAVGPLGVVPVDAANGLVSGHFHAGRVRPGDAGVAAEAFDDHVRRLGAGLFSAHRIVVALAEHIQPAQLDGSREPAAGKAAHNMQRRSEEAQQDHQHPFAAGDAARRQRLLARSPEQNLDRSQNAPQDQQERPELGQIIQQPQIRIQVARQKNQPQADQQQRREQGSPSHMPLGPAYSATLHRPNTISSTGQLRPKVIPPM